MTRQSIQDRTPAQSTVTRRRPLQEELVFNAHAMLRQVFIFAGVDDPTDAGRTTAFEGTLLAEHGELQRQVWHLEGR
jgi:hypothetical protein